MQNKYATVQQKLNKVVVVVLEEEEEEEMQRAGPQENEEDVRGRRQRQSVRVASSLVNHSQ